MSKCHRVACIALCCRSRAAGARRLQSIPGVDVGDWLQVPQVWAQYGTRGRGTKVGVFDTGVTMSHPHFRHGNVRTCVGYTPGGGCRDGVGHGTMVAGLIGSAEECMGLAPEAELHVFKVFTDQRLSRTSWVLDALNHALELELDVINLSIGGLDFQVTLPFVCKEGGEGVVGYSEGALVRQAKFQRSQSHLQPFGGICLDGIF